MRLCLALACMVAALALPARAENLPPGFKKLTGAEIRRAFVGHTFTDEVHFSLSYRASGVVQGMSMGKQVTHPWSIANDRLCEAEETGTTCYIVLNKGADVFLRRDGIDLSVDGVLK